MRIIRKIALKILKYTAFDINIKHHFTKYMFHLNTYAHKGYWYYGANRESDTIKIFKSWISPDHFILEIGGHIGYFSTLYAFLVGQTGKVDVFEPSQVNIQYLKKNIGHLPIKLQEIVTVIDKGVGDTNDFLDFYIDPITGQNNSFVPNFEGFIANRKISAESNSEIIKDKVEVIRLDTYFANKTRYPDFVKIDVEGFEWNVIQGFVSTIEKTHPAFMIEIQADSEKLIKFFKERSYTIYNDELIEIFNHSDYERIKTANIFFKYNK